jgi:hypothetical protein
MGRRAETWMKKVLFLRCCGEAKRGLVGAPKMDFMRLRNVGVYIVMVCRWTDHILARNPLLEVEADLPDGGNFPTRFSLINWRARNSKIEY